MKKQIKVSLNDPEFVGYRGNTDIGEAYFYCPNIPILPKFHPPSKRQMLKEYLGMTDEEIDKIEKDIINELSKEKN